MGGALQEDVSTKQKNVTLGEVELLMASAGKYTGGVLKHTDEGLIEPFVSRFLRYNILHGKDPRGKGNYIAKPLGFASYQSRVVMVQSLIQILNLSTLSPKLEQATNYRDILEEIAKAWDLETSQVVKTLDQLNQEAQAESQQAEILMRLQALEMALKQAQVEKTQAEADLIEEKARTEEVIQDVKAAEVDIKERGQEIETGKTIATLAQAGAKAGGNDKKPQAQRGGEA
jgi:hypothetical protein